MLRENKSAAFQAALSRKEREAENDVPSHVKSQRILRSLSKVGKGVAAGDPSQPTEEEADSRPSSAVLLKRPGSTLLGIGSTPPRPGSTPLPARGTAGTELGLPRTRYKLGSVKPRLVETKGVGGSIGDARPRSNRSTRSAKMRFGANMWSMSDFGLGDVALENPELRHVICGTVRPNSRDSAIRRRSTWLGHPKR